MAYTFYVQKSERTKLRRLPFLPRFGITVETFGRQLTFKQVPLLETLLNLRDRGLSLSNFRRLAKEEWDEIRFPGRPALAAVKDFSGRAPQPKAHKPASRSAASKQKAASSSGR